jgi:secretion/DNA translocation related TadE-like protein
MAYDPRVCPLLPTRHRPAERELGAGSVLGLAITLGISTLAIGGLTAYAALPQRNVLQSAADSAALTAANAVSGRIQGYPCDLASQAAELNGAELVSCDLQGLEVTVQVSGTVLGIAVSIASRAGPPPHYSTTAARRNR